MPTSATYRAIPEVPVVVFAYNRAEALRRCLESLSANGISRLYLFVDGPKPDEPRERVDAVHAVVSAVDWIEPVVHTSPHNRGLSAAIRVALDHVLGTHDRVIVVEDDILVAPEFYRYMVQCLERYAHVDEIAGVTGLRYPFARRALERYPGDVFLSPRFSSWGWGTWASFWDGVEFDRDRLRARVDATRFRPERGGDDLRLLSSQYLNGSLHGAWDVACAINMLLDDRSFVCPKWNLVSNIGFLDGTHPGDKPPSWRLEWETGRERLQSEIAFPRSSRRDRRVMRDYRRFFEPPRYDPGLRAKVWWRLRKVAQGCGSRARVE